jgi:pimeloyl-ACP methyl ester carboxylesterase
MSADGEVAPERDGTSRPARRRLVTAGIAAGAVAGGVAGRTVLRARRRRDDGDATAGFAELPPEDLGSVTSSDGTRIAVRAAGERSRPPIVFVHGFSLDLTTWHGQWTALADRYRCVLFDLRAHGRSEVPASGDLSPEAFGEDLAAVVSSLPGRRRAMLVGHSLGAIAILAMARSRGEPFAARVGACVFAGSSSGNLMRGAIGNVRALITPGVETLRRVARGVDGVRRAVLSGDRDVGIAIARLMQFGPDADPDVVRHIVGLAAIAPSSVWTGGLARLLDVDLRTAVGHVGVPSLVLVGEHDRVTPRASAQALADALPDGRLEVLERAGHIAMMEVPAAFNERIDAFAGATIRAAKRKQATT